MAMGLLVLPQAVGDIARAYASGSSHGLSVAVAELGWLVLFVALGLRVRRGRSENGKSEK